MTGSSLRMRFLLAMGLACPSLLGSAACSSSAAPEGGAQPDAAQPSPEEARPSTHDTARVIDPAGQATNDAVRTTPDAGEPVATATKATAEPVEVPRPLPGDFAPRPERASCPSGKYCVAAPSKLEGLPAPAPYAECAAIPSDFPQWNPYSVFDPTGTAAARDQDPKACCYSWSQPCPGGRPLYDARGPVLAASTARADWSMKLGAPSAELSAETRTLLGAHWLREAAAEHASVASFARFSLQLLALGAPAELVAGAQRAGLDEIGHARACYALSSRYTDELVGPGVLPLPIDALQTNVAGVARETLRDGCIGETLAARVMAEAAASAVDAQVATVLTRIAEEESAHAELAWRSLSWMLLSHAEAVRPALEAELAALEASLGPMPASSARSTPDLGEHGVLPEARRTSLQHEAMREVVVPCLRALLLASSA